MGVVDDAKETLGAAGERIKREVHDAGDRINDKVDEHKAEADVKKAEAERESVKQRNELKEDLRD